MLNLPLGQVPKLRLYGAGWTSVFLTSENVRQRACESNGNVETTVMWSAADPRDKNWVTAREIDTVSSNVSEPHIATGIYNSCLLSPTYMRY